MINTASSSIRYLQQHHDITQNLFNFKRHQLTSVASNSSSSSSSNITWGALVVPPNGREGQQQNIRVTNQLLRRAYVTLVSQSWSRKRSDVTALLKLQRKNTFSLPKPVISVRFSDSIAGWSPPPLGRTVLSSTTDKGLLHLLSYSSLNAATSPQRNTSWIPCGVYLKWE